MIDITDILDEIKFGYLSDMHWIVKANSLEENFKDLWKPIYHFFYGLCFMFESRNSSLLSPLGDTYLIAWFNIIITLFREILYGIYFNIRCIILYFT